MAQTLALLAAGAVATSAAAQDCAPFWTGVASPAANFTSLIALDDGTGVALYGGGIFPAGTPSPRSRVARWNGQTWESLLAGWPTNTGCAPYNPELLTLDFGQGPRLCAYMVANASQPCKWQLRMWTGAEWVSTPPNMVISNFLGPRVSVDHGAGPRIYGFLGAGRAVGRWTGTSWEDIGLTDGQVGLFRVLDLGDGPHLYVAGQFNRIDNRPIRAIAKWTGTAWEPLGAGLYDWHVRDMIAHDDGTGPKLYVANTFSITVGEPINGIARWDPLTQEWSDVGGGGIPSTGGIVQVYSLGSFDDGRGPALYAGGMFTLAGGGVPVRCVARFDGTQWDDVMGGVGGGFPYAYAVFDDGRGPSLFVAGGFNQVGAGGAEATNGIAQIVGCPNCYADCDNSPTPPRLNVADFTCFLQKYAARDPYADCSRDRAIDAADFACFLQKFTAGCP